MYNYGGEEWKNQLLFRDYLRTHPEVLKNYNDLKQSLAEKYRNDRVAYTNAKNPFITEVIQIAKSSIAETK